mmetsp:Transcript_91219/g.181358  ORF Transcript_91219/g.181358 Transcript_91219/m.181358 type:complete len:100 (+) Transcript_91219:1177-1476(+)
MAALPGALRKRRKSSVLSESSNFGDLIRACATIETSTGFRLSRMSVRQLFGIVERIDVDLKEKSFETVELIDGDLFIVADDLTPKRSALLMTSCFTTPA